jgi:hypothetical protein
VHAVPVGVVTFRVLQVGSKITTAVDTFSFGIMMWELYTGQRAYSGLGRDAIIDRCAQPSNEAFASLCLILLMLIVYIIISILEFAQL